MSNTCCYEKSSHGVYLRVKVVAKASKNEVLGLVGDRIKVAVRAVPQNGEANNTLEEVIADFFRLKKSNCCVTAGHKSSLKTVFISADVEEQILAAFS